MAGRSTRSNTANDTNPPNETADEVARQLNTALPNLLTQLVQAPEGNRVNQREATPSCSIKTFRTSGAKEFFGTKGAVGLLTWFESIEAVFHITKCLAKSQVEFASSMLQGRALTWWNTLNHKMVGSYIDGYTARFHELARLVPHMVTPESQRVNRYIRGLAPEIKAHVTSSQPATIQGAVGMANRLTTDGIKDGIFKKKENENAFQTLKDMLCDAPILALLEDPDDFVVYCGASNQDSLPPSIKAKILKAQSEAFKNASTPTEMLNGLDKQLKRKEDGGLYLAERIWVPVYGNSRTLIMNEAYAT
nr:hypothetical protein [Tanacetum cinerariifolium]